MDEHHTKMPMNDTKQTFSPDDDDFESLKQEYVHDFIQRLPQLVSLIEQGLNGSPTALREAIYGAHNWRGTAKLFDLAAVGAAMADIETALSMATRDAPASASNSDVRRTIDRALMIARAAISETESRAGSR